MAKDTTAGSKKVVVDGSGFVQKQKVGGEDRGQQLPNFGERNRHFLLGAHPTSWDQVHTSKGWRLVPTLKRLIVQAGVNFTRAPAKEGMTLDSSDIEAKFRSKFGVKVLVDVDQYMYVTPGVGKTEGHFLLWENVKVYPDGEYEISMDQDGYDLWRWSLVVDGIVEPPRDSVIAQMRTRLTRARGRATRTPHLAQAQEAKAAAEERLAGLDAALKALKAPKASPSKADAPEGDGAAA